MLKLRKNKKGFTLVELIVVIAIMAVLAGTVAGVTVSQLNKSKNDTAASEIKNLLNDFETFLTTYDVSLIDSVENAKNAVNAFATEKKNSKGLGEDYALLTYKDADANGKLPAASIKAGAGQYAYNVTYTAAQPEKTENGTTTPAQPAKITLTIWCDKVGSTGATPSAERTYEI